METISNNVILINEQIELLDRCDEKDVIVMEGIFSNIIALIKNSFFSLRDKLKSVVNKLKGGDFAVGLHKNLTPDIRVRLIRAVNLIVFASYVKPVFPVPAGLKGDVTNYSIMLEGHMNKYHSSFVESLKIVDEVSSSIVSGNGAEGIVSINSYVKELNKIKKEYYKERSKFFHNDSINEYIALIDAFDNSGDIVKAFGVLRNEVPLANAEFIDVTLNTVNKISDKIGTLNSESLAKKNLMEVSSSLGKFAENVEFVALINYEYQKNISSYINTINTLMLKVE